MSVAAATERARWTAAGDVATFLELEPPPEATLPLTLNVFFRKSGFLRIDVP